MLFSLFLVPCLLPFLVNAIQQSQVGLVDWHKSLIGVPLEYAPPSFHRLQLDVETTQSVVVTATSSNVLAAVNPVNGSLVWRHIMDEGDFVVGFTKQDDVLASLSGPSGSTLRIFDALSGLLIHETRMHEPGLGLLSEPPNIGAKVALLRGSDDVYALTNGRTVTKFAREGPQDYQKAWQWDSTEQTSLTLYSHILSTPTHVYVAGLSKSFTGFTLQVTIIDSQTGQAVEEGLNIPGAQPKSFADVILTRSSHPSQPSRLVYLTDATISSVPLTDAPKELKSPTVIKYFDCSKLLDVGLNEHGMLVAVKSDGTARALKLDEAGLRSVWEFRDSASSPRHADSLYPGGVDKEGRPYIARVFWSFEAGAASVHLLAPHMSEGQGVVSGFTFPFETDKHGVITHAAIDAASPNPHSVVSRLVITTTTGAIQLWQSDRHQWTREESLANIAPNSAVLLSLPESRSVVASRDGIETVIQRVARQMQDAKDFHHYLINFVHRFLQPSSETLLAFTPPDATGPSVLTRDTFGFRQLLIVATNQGTVYGIESQTGDIKWSRVLGLGWAGDADPEKGVIGGKILPVGVFTLKQSEGEKNAEVVIVAQRRANNGLVDTVVFHINSLTGNDARTGIPIDRAAGPLQGYDIIHGPAVDVFFLPPRSDPSGSGTVILLDEFLQVYGYPYTDDLSEVTSGLHFPLRSTTAGKQAILGHNIAFNPDLSERPVGYPTWKLSLGEGESILNVKRPNTVAGQGTAKDRRIASWGKVLGNRTTLYKWINQRAVVVLTKSPPTITAEAQDAVSATCGLYVVDSVKGTVFYHTVVPAIPSPTSPMAEVGDGSCDLKVSFVENWLVYHYYDTDTSVNATKGWKMVSVEFYEGESVDDKTSSSDLSSFNSDNLRLSAYEMSFILPYGITAMTTSETMYGITSKDLIVATRNHRIATIPRRFLNPRRPNRKPTSQEAEEGLIQYDPVIGDDPRRVLSHVYDVANVHSLISSPTLLESTALVFAYGSLDIFMSRVSPSGTFDVLSAGFNKVQLVFTVSALLLGILITKPMVRRKKERERWYE
jgi:hypothetical protein